MRERARRRPLSEEPLGYGSSRVGGSRLASARPEAAEGQRTVIVGRLEGMDLRRSDLHEAFSTAGVVQSVQLHRGYATVTFKESHGATYAIKTFDGGKLGDRTIDVYLNTQAEGRATPARGGRQESPPPRQEAPAKRSRRDEAPMPRDNNRSRLAASGAGSSGRAPPERVASRGAPPHGRERSRSGRVAREERPRHRATR